jgi:hypothetical protein
VAWVSSVFFGQAIVGKDLSDESSADLEAPLGECLGDRIPIEIGLETRTDDEGLNLLGAFRRSVWAWPFGEEVGWRSVEDGVADIVIGFACLEAEAGSELALGEAAEFPESDHTDLLLDGLFLGESDGLPSTVSEHERAFLSLNVEAKSDMHGRPLPRGGLADYGALQICIRNFCQTQEPSPGENGQTNSAGFDGYKCRYGRELKHMERHWTALAIIPYTFGKYQVPLERGAM